MSIPSLPSDVLLLFKGDLQHQRNELARTIESTHREISRLADFAPGDIVDHSCGNSCKEAMFTNYSHNRIRLRKIEDALNRITNGDFGICANCEGPIGFKRLQALPWASNCIDCQEQCEHEYNQGRTSGPSGINL